MASVRVSVPNINSQIRQATKGVDEIVRERYRERQLSIGELFVQMCTRYVPWRSGELASSGKAYIEGQDRLRVRWSKENNGYDYAKIQYDNHDYTHSNGRTAEWDKTMLTHEGELFYKRVEDILNK